MILEPIDREFQMWKTSKPNISKMIEKKDVEALIHTLDARDSSLVAAAAKALGDLRDPKAIKPLKKTAVTGNLAAIAALGRIGGPEAISVLVHLTGREDFPHHVRAGAIQALGNADDPQIADHIKGFLTSKDNWILRETLTVLRRFLSEKEVAFLIREQQELQSSGGTERSGILLCARCAKNFTPQQARIDSILSKDGAETHFLFLCPECDSPLLDAGGTPYEELEKNHIEDEP